MPRSALLELSGANQTRPLTLKLWLSLFVRPQSDRPVVRSATYLSLLRLFRAKHHTHNAAFNFTSLLDQRIFFQLITNTRQHGITQF